jgi:hypothetical protein
MQHGWGKSEMYKMLYSGNPKENDYLEYLCIRVRYGKGEASRVFGGVEVQLHHS